MACAGFKSADYRDSRDSRFEVGLEEQVPGQTFDSVSGSCDALFRRTFLVSATVRFGQRLGGLVAEWWRFPFRKCRGVSKVALLLAIGGIRDEERGFVLCQCLGWSIDSRMNERKE